MNTQALLSPGTIVYHPRLSFEKDGRTIKRCTVVTLRISQVYPEYLGNAGLRYSAHQLHHTPDCGMAYKPSSIFTNREEAVQALRANVTQRIAFLTEALDSIS